MKEAEEEKRRIINRLAMSQETNKLNHEHDIIHCQQLLRRLYECLEDMEVLLDEGKDDHHYHQMVSVINRLEVYLQNKQDLM